MNVSKWHLKTLAAALAAAALLAALIGCTGATTTTSTTTTTTPTTTGPGGGTIIHNDSIVTAQIEAIGVLSGYLTSVDVLIISSENVDDLPNETADKVNTVITVQTDEDILNLIPGQQITAHVPLAGDVPNGIYLYMYDIKLLQSVQ